MKDVIFLFDYKNEKYEELLKKFLEEVNFFKDIPLDTIEVSYLYESKEDTKSVLPEEFYDKMKNKLKNATCYILFGKETYASVYKLLKKRTIKSESFIQNYKKLTFIVDDIIYISTLSAGYVYRVLAEEPNSKLVTEFKLHLIELREYIKTRLR